MNMTIIKNESIVTGEPILKKDLASTAMGCSEEDKECPTNHWVTNTSYCPGSSGNLYDIWNMFSDGEFNRYNHDFEDISGVRPAIVIPASLI